MRSEQVVQLLLIVAGIILFFALLSSAFGMAFLDTVFDLLGAYVAVFRMPILLGIAIVVMFGFLSALGRR